MSFKSMAYDAAGKLAAAVLEYDTLKIVHIKDKRIGFIYRFVQLAIILYIIVYGIVWQKGYQITGPVTGTVTTKVKGAYRYNGTEDYKPSCAGLFGDSPDQVFDAGDYVIPPEEPNSFFVITNLWQTCEQVQSNCSESPNVYNSDCDQDGDCPRGTVLEAGNGPFTGKCVNDSHGGTTKRCEISGWCPTELEDDTVTNSGPKIDITDFTVLVKNVIEFPTIQKGLRKRNIKTTADKNYFKECRFNESEGLYCPIFSLGQIIEMIEPTRTIPWRQTVANISVKGGVVGLEIHWDCDHLEFNLNRCHPKYVAKRYDDPNVGISDGFNFRYSQYYYDSGVQKRILTKAYGVLFKIEISGTGGKFDFVTLILKLGSMIALLSIATIVADVLVLYICKGREYYRKKKYLNVNHPTADYVIIDRDQEEIRGKLFNDDEDETSEPSDV